MSDGDGYITFISTCHGWAPKGRPKNFTRAQPWLESDSMGKEVYHQST